jgi:hypothetical protein
MKIDYLYADEEITGEFIIKKMSQWRDDPFLWMVEQVYTIDEADAEAPVKRFPRYRYLKEIIDCYFENKTMILCKSRRMMATHVFSTLMVHQLLFRPYSENVIVSINEDRAKAVLQRRCKAVYDFLDKRFPYPKLREGQEIRTDRMFNPYNGAQITALPSGSDKCRGLTITNGFYDELAFQSNVEMNLKSLKPALEGDGCRAALVSTPKFATPFQKLVQKIHKQSHMKTRMEGLTEYRNEYNQTVLLLKYTADPEKRTQEWYHKERYGASPDGKSLPGCSGVDVYTWDQEYELKFTVPVGKPVVPEIEAKSHCEPYDKSMYDPDRTMHITCDFGHYASMSFFQKDNLNRCVIHKVVLACGIEVEEFQELGKQWLLEYFPGSKDNFKLHGDPAGGYGSGQGHAATAWDVMQKVWKHHVHGKKSSPADRAMAIRLKASKKVGGAMGIIFPLDCGELISYENPEDNRNGLLLEGFQIGWVYKQPKEGDHYKDVNPHKDGFYEHIFDGLGYGFVNEFPAHYDKAYEARTGRKKSPSRPKKRHLRL